MGKIEDLKKLESEMEADASLPLCGEANLVFGEGDPDCAVLFIGEAPGFHENEQRRPFVGRGGQLLNRLMEGISWKREDVYITNIVKRRPPDNRDPMPEEIEAYKPYLARQIETISPKIIATLGRFSMNYFLPNAKITRDQGKVFWWRGESNADQAPRWMLIMPIFHPAAALRSTGVLAETKASFTKLKKVTERFGDFLAEKLAKEAEEAKSRKEQTSLL